MNLIKPEELKTIAEYMHSHTSFRVISGGVYNDDGKLGCHEYNPLTNPEQLLELMGLFEWIGIEWPMGRDTELCICEVRRDLVESDLIIAEGKTLPEAVIKAVLEMIGEQHATIK